MAQTRMDSRIESMERSLSLLDQRLHGIELELTEGKQHRAELTKLLTEALKGKGHDDESGGSQADASPRNQANRGTSRLVSLDEVQLAAKKVELPNFNGSDPLGWVRCAEQYFQVQCTPEDTKVSLAMVCMEGHAIHWMSWRRDKKPALSWAELRDEVLTRFGSALASSPFEELAAVKQTGSIEEYIQAFVAKAAYVQSLPEGVIVAQYLNGLKGTIRSRIRPHEAIDLYRTLSISCCIEYEMEVNGCSSSGGSVSKGEEYGLGSKAGLTFWSSLANSGAASPVGRKTFDSPTAVKSGPSQSPSLQQTHTTTGNTATQQAKMTNSSRFSTANNNGVRRYSQREHQELRNKGLCYRCHQPYSPLHRCATKTLHTIVLDMGDEDEATADGGDSAVVPAAVEECQRMQLELPLYSLGRTGLNQVPKLCGKIGELEVLVLVDSGASHCFLSQEIVVQLGFKIQPTVGTGVKLGDGRREKVGGFCPAVPVDFNSVQITVDCYVFPLGDVDLVLGVSWLQTLGDIKLNWRNMTMEFGCEGKNILMKGDCSLFQDPLTFKSLDRISPLVEGMILWQSVLEGSKFVEGEVSKEQKKELQRVLQNLEDIFREPLSLPPKRVCDHAIPLLPGVNSVSVKPYRYGLVQKDEIERQVQEMLRFGIIQPSTGPFSSLVLLVKKKDGSWRFCVDYRELNKATVSDKYPIPVIQELLDELSDAKYFSKIDLRSGYHQIRVKLEDVLKTAFRTHSGHYEFKVMPFGLKNAPATFQATMNDLFRPYLRRYVLVFFDDILIYSSTWIDHLKHVAMVLRMLLKNNFLANRKKSVFGQRKIEYLGHVISEEGVAMDPAKVASVLQWPIPKSVKGVRAFLGLTGYYRRFIRDYGVIARPLRLRLV